MVDKYNDFQRQIPFFKSISRQKMKLNWIFCKSTLRSESGILHILNISQATDCALVLLRVVSSRLNV